MKTYQTPKGILIVDGDLYDIEGDHKFLGINIFVSDIAKELNPSEIQGNPPIMLLGKDELVISFYSEDTQIRWEPWMAEHIQSIFEMLVKAHRQGYEDGYEDT